jgi:peroxiredoxin
MNGTIIVALVLIGMVVLVNFILTLALVRRVNSLSQNTSLTSDTSELLQIDQVAPNFSAETLEGTVVTMADYARKVVAFLFISTTCPPCRELISEVKALQPQAVNAGVEVVLVSTDNIEQTRQFARELNVNLPILVAPRAENPFATHYKVNATPTYYLVDNYGKVKSAGIPHPNFEKWRNLIKTWEFGV